MSPFEPERETLVGFDVHARGAEGPRIMTRGAGGAPGNTGT